MSSLSRKIERNKLKLAEEYQRKMTKPDSECDKCMLPERNDCFLTCERLLARNRKRYSDLVKRVEAIIAPNEKS